MKSFLFALFLSFLFNYLIVRYKDRHANWTSDSDLAGPQKFHTSAVPRIGGLAIFLSLAFTSILDYIEPTKSNQYLFLLVTSSVFAFLSGLLEDITKKVGILQRLIGTALSAYFVGYLFNIWITRVDAWGIGDLLLTIPATSILLTCFAISGLANAYNIIDGFNGLASMIAMITLLAISYVSFIVGDLLVMHLCIVMIGAIAGFFVWNFPRGLIFLGDGGAYLIGFWIGALSTLLIARNSNVSPWFALLVNGYPIFETIFTIWRRMIHKRRNPGMPDGVHFHSLLYRRIIKRSNSSIPELNSAIKSNSKTSPYIWLISSITIVPTVLWWSSTPILAAFTLLFFIGYIFLYRSIVRFQKPKWLALNNRT